MRTLSMQNGALRTVEGIEAAVAALAQPGLVWIDADADEPGLAAFLSDVLHLHPLVVEDILERQAVPKVEDYGEYLYVVAHGVVGRQSSAAALVTTEIDLVVSQRWVFTHHHGSTAAAGVRADLSKNPRPLARGAAFVAHAILDRLVDEYMPLIDVVDEELESLEASVMARPGREVLARIFELKRLLQHFRRTAVHQRELLHRLSRGEYDLVSGDALPFYRDVYDHFLRVADLADSYREHCSSAMEAYLSAVSNRMNEVMKTLTIFTTVFMPMTFLVGIYGMNFDNMPELHWRMGYLGVWVLLVLMPIGMVAWFRSRKWM
jgi:magnesium transporter